MFLDISLVEKGEGRIREGEEKREMCKVLFVLSPQATCTLAILILVNSSVTVFTKVKSNIKFSRILKNGNL